MAPFGPLADIPPEILALIGDGLDLLEFYCRARSVCTAWRAALPPPIPSLVTVTVPPPGASPLYRHFPEVFALFLPADRLFPLTTFRRRHRSLCVVGSSNGWLAVDAGRSSSCSLAPGIYLVSHLSGGKEIPLLPLRNDNKPVPKIVFAPNPKPDDYVAIAICDLRRLAYVKTRDMKWMILDIAIGERDKLVDLAYDTDDGKVYCVTLLGDVHVLHIPQRQRRRPVVEPLMMAERAGHPFDPAAVYAPPYDTASKFTSVKNVFFLGGNLYQVWRNAAGARSWLTPDGGRFVMLRDDMFVLKYNPERRRRPCCWDAVPDLGGYSVFVGKNHPVVLLPRDAPGVTANSVYWINEQSRNEPMVFDMVTRTSTPHPSAAKALPPSCMPVCCWYFLDDKITEVQDNNGRKRRLSLDHYCEQVNKSSRKAH
ncbi:hypothetical protein BDA96_06G129100 [Sorghum bicolor]|jgi:hypothetical protein|uniref:KIB1-4 beta-propeller domain-containing protein n=2 Tax=Sorghum bicolor TaxID=4558 RepID=A0A1Z5RDE0_SORBI|nr:hypothetical protein BDA96_06G129100 [Sorghum bicolor]OQU81770.1 hypothetical protein SORBI_3006G116400 [Sorghum bicolor]